MGMVLVNPFLRFTKMPDFLLKSSVLRARVPEWRLIRCAWKPLRNLHVWSPGSLFLGHLMWFIGRTPKGAYSSRGSSRHLLETAFSEPRLRTFSEPQNPLRTPSPEPSPRTFSETFLERCVAVRPLRRAPNFSENPSAHPNRNFWGSNFGPHPQPQISLLRIFCLRPGLGWKFLTMRTWSGQKRLPLQFPGLSFPY